MIRFVVRIGVRDHAAVAARHERHAGAAGIALDVIYEIPQKAPVGLGIDPPVVIEIKDFFRRHVCGRCVDESHDFLIENVFRNIMRDGSVEVDHADLGMHRLAVFVELNVGKDLIDRAGNLRAALGHVLRRYGKPAEDGGERTGHAVRLHGKDLAAGVAACVRILEIADLHHIRNDDHRRGSAADSKNRRPNRCEQQDRGHQRDRFFGH